MLSQQLSSSSSLSDNDNENSPPLEPRMDLNDFITKLCAIVQVPVDKEDITSQRFGECLLDYVREAVGDYDKLIETIVTTHAQRRPFRPDLNTIPRLSPEEATESWLRYCPSEVSNTKSSPQHGVSSPSSSPPCGDSATSPLPAPVPTDIPSNDEKHENGTNMPVSSSNLQDLGKPQITIGIQVGSTPTVRLENEDPLIIELMEAPVPSSSRQIRPRKSNDCQSSKTKACTPHDRKKNKKKANRQISKKKIHIALDSRNGLFRYRCTCRSKFSSKGAQTHHIKYFNSVWKFTCDTDKCPKKFYNLSRLKQHLKIQHGIKNPLKEFVTGCTLCGHKFKTRIEFAKHTKSHIQKRPRRQGKRSCEVTPTGSQGSTQNEVVDLTIEDGQLASDCPLPPQIVEQDNHDDGATTSVLREDADSGYRYCCVICGQAFVSFFGAHTNMSKHMRIKHNSGSEDVECEICGIVFATCEDFDQHWISSNH